MIIKMIGMIKAVQSVFSDELWKKGTDAWVRNGAGARNVGECKALYLRAKSLDLSGGLLAQKVSALLWNFAQRQKIQDFDGFELQVTHMAKYIAKQVKEMHSDDKV